MNASYLIGPEAPVLPEKLFAYNAGGFVNFRLSYIMSVRTELSYTVKKYQFSDEIDFLEDARYRVSETNTYLTVPVLLTFKQGDDVINAFINFGPEFALLIKHERDLSATSNGLEISGEPYYSFDLNPYDFGLSAGGGIQFRNFIADSRIFLSLHPLYAGNESLEMRYSNVFVNLAYIINYQPPSNFSRPTTWKSFKYKLRNLFR